MGGEWGLEGEVGGWQEKGEWEGRVVKDRMVKRGHERKEQEDRFGGGDKWMGQGSSLVHWR